MELFLDHVKKSTRRSRGRSGTTVTLPTTSNQQEAESSSTSSTLRRTGHFHIPTTKAVDTYDVLSGSSDEEDNACFLCGHSLQS